MHMHGADDDGWTRRRYRSDTGNERADRSIAPLSYLTILTTIKLYLANDELTVTVFLRARANS